MPATKTETANVATIRSLFDAINRGDLDRAARDFAAADFVRHDLTGSIPDVAGRAGARNFLGGLKSQMPDLTLEIEDLFGSADRVTVRFVVRGTIAGGAERRRSIAFNNINIYRLLDGHVVETWQLADQLSLARQRRRSRQAVRRRVA